MRITRAEGTYFSAGLKLAVKIQTRSQVFENPAALVGAVGALGQPEQAVRLMSAVQALQQATRITVQPADQMEYNH